MIRAQESPDTFLACHRLALAELPPMRLRALLAAAQGDPLRALERRDGLTGRQLARLDEAQRLPLPERLHDAAEGIVVLCYGAPDYPEALLPYDDAPALLFVRGSPAALSGRLLAVVGSRRATGYGREQATRFARCFAEQGWGVVSGGAAGVDTSAHRGALDAGGTTVAAVASGLDTVYPAENRALFARIAAEGGAVVSEFPLGTLPEPWRFPTRNRIIAGLARATVVIEAPDGSGALITARNAAEYGRDVYVVPGPVDTERSRGGHRLVQDGALLADRPEDVLEGLGSQLSLPLPASPGPAAPAVSLSTDEAALLARFDRSTARYLDAVAAEAGLEAARAGVAATLLEMKGCLVRQPGGLLRRAAHT